MPDVRRTTEGRTKVEMVGGSLTLVVATASAKEAL